MRPLPSPFRRLALTLLKGAGLLAVGVWGCGGGDGNTGAGGVLVVSQVQIDAGNRVVLVGGTRQLTASPRTSTGIVVPGKTAAWSSSNPLVASVSSSGVVTGHDIGPATITATVDGVAGRVDLDVRPVPVATVEVALGAATLLAGLTTTAQATARDSVAGVLPGRVPAWSSNNEQVATVSQGGVVTAVSSGTAQISATIEGKVGTATLTVTARAASKLGFITQPTQAVAGAAIAPPIQVAFQDATGGTANETPGTITLSFSSNPTGATLGGTLSVAAINGIATFSNVRVDRAGQPYSLQASATGFAIATSATFAVGSAVASGLGIAVAPAGSAASGAPLGVQPVIEVRDALGNRVAQAGVVVTASVASGPGVLSGTTTATTAADGRATFTNLAITGAVGTYTLRFAAPGLAEIVSSPIGLGAGGASQLTFTTAPPATQPNGEPLPAPVRVQLRDGTGNPVAQAGTSVTASLQGGAALLSGTLTAVTGANGEAVFTGLVITGVVGNYTLTFSATGVTPAVSNPIALGPGTERAIGFVTAPATTSVNGALLPTAPVLQLRDISGNPVPKAGVVVQVELQTVLLGALGGSLSRTTDAQGRATFSDLVITGQVGSYTLAFGAGTLSEAVSNPIQLLAGPAVGLGFKVAPPLGAQNGVPLVPQPVIQVVDQSGNAVAQGGLTVTAALASGPGLLGGTATAVTDGTGAAAFTGLLLNGATGSYILRFSATGFPNLVSTAITVGAGAPTQLTFTTAPPASAQNAVAIAPAVVVQLRDGVGNPVAQSGVSVTATLASGPGLLGGTVNLVTDAGGSASFANLVITGTVGNYTLQFAAAGLTPAVSNPVTLTAGTATQLTFTTAPPATATNGATLAPAIVIQLRDVSGNPVAQAGVNVVAAIFTGSNATLNGTTTVATAGSGAASFSTLSLLGQAGNFTLRFSATGVTPATSNPVALQPGAATALAMATQPPPSSSSGAVLSPQPAVRLVDQSGNLVPTSGVTITAALASGPGTLGGTLTANTVNGVAAFSNLAITGTTGSYQISFSATGLTGVTSGTIGLGAGAATALQFVGTPPTSATHGVAIAPAIQVRLIDASSNPVAQAGVVVTAVLSPGSPSGGGLGGTTTASTNGTGVATFSNLILTGTIGNYAIRFDVSGITSVTTAAITLAPGAAAQLTLTTPPSSPATNGMALGTQPVVQLRDASGNAVSQAGVVVTASISAGPAGSLSNATAATNASGLATFAGLAITGPTGAYTLQFASGVLTPVTAGVSLQAGAASRLAVATAPGASAVSGQPLSPQPVIQLQDQSGNPVGSAGVSVTVAFAATPGAATLGGTTTVATAANGQAAFTDLVISGATGSYQLAFSSTGLTGATSGSITLGAGAATQLTFTTAPPASATNGVDLSPAIVVQARDGSGNPVAQAGLSVAAAIGTNPGGVLSGTTPVLTDANGVATFSNLRITGTAGGYTLAFTSGALTGALSNTITLQPGPATQLAFTTAPPSTAVNGATLAPSPVVQLRDQSGNPVPTSGTSITADLSAGAGGTLGGTLVETTTSGSATFDDLAITGMVGSYTLRFSSGGLTPVSAPAPHLSLTAGPATQLGLAVAPSSTATSGAALAIQPQVQVRDQSGNPVAQNGLLVTAVVSAGASLSNATATTGANGLATFSGLAVTGPAADYTLSFQASGFPDLAGGTVTVAAGAATQMVFITAPPSSATNGAPLSPQPVVELRDGSGNPVLVAGTTVTVSLLSGAGVLMGTATVQTTGDGRATFAGLNLQGNPGTYVLRFASGSLPTLDSGNITLAIGPATKLIFQAAPPASATNGQLFSASTEVALADLTGNVVPTDGVSIVAQVATGPGATLGGTTSRQTTGGVATFNDLSLTGTAGNYTLSFSSGGLTPAVSNPIALQPGPATQLEFATAPPTSGASGAALTPAPVIALRDASNNTVPQAGVTVTATILAGTGTVTGASAITDGTGQATFPGLTISGAVGNYTLAFTSGSLQGVTSAPIALSAGAPAKLSFVATPSATVQNDKPLAVQPVVQLLDAANNPVAQAGVDITVSINSGGGALSATSLMVATASNGRATFAGLTITGGIGIRTLAFGGSGLTTLVSGDIDVTAGDPAGLAMVVQPPGSAASGTGFSSDPSVRLVDVSGNAVAVSGTSVSVALLVPGGATLGGTTTRTTDGTGVATFPGLSITGPGGSYQLQFTSTSLASVTSSAITLSGATGLAITTQPSASVANDAVFPQQPTVQLVDGVTPIAQAGVVVTAAIKTGQGTLMGTVTATTDAGGLATFADLRIRGLVGDRTIEFTATGLTPVTSNTLTVTPGTATALAMVTQPPATALSGATLAPAPSVRLVDISSNAVASQGVDVTVAVSPAGSLGGTTTVATDASGVAAFPGLSITGAGGDYQLDFTATSLAGVSSGTITLTSATGVSITTQPSATVRNDIALAQQPVVRLVDAADAPVAISGIQVTAEIASGGGTLMGTVAATTNGSGVATFTDLRIQGTVGIRTLRFVASGLTPDTSTSVTVTAGIASAIAMVTEPAATVVDEQAFPVSPVARLVDVSGNAVDSTGVTIAVAVTPAGPVLGGTTSQPTVAGGTATFTGLSLNGSAGDYRLEFSGTSLSSVQSSQVTLLVPAGIQVTTQPSSAATRNVVFPVQPQVTVTDAGAAGVQGVVVTAALVTISGPAGTLGGTANQTTGAGGVATWAGLLIQKPNSGPGQYLLRFTTANGLTVDSDPIAVP